MGEGTPQSSALTEGDFVPDSPTLSPIELKQELPKYLPALQVRRSHPSWLCSADRNRASGWEPKPGPQCGCLSRSLW